MEELIITLPADYGYTELKKRYKRYMSIGLLFGLLFVITGVSAYWLTVYLTTEDEPVAMIRIMKYSELGPPPSISNNDVAQSIAVSGPAVKPTVGIPVPVPDAQVSPEQTIATQQELSNQGNQAGEGMGGGGQVLQDVSVKEEKQEINIDDGPPPDFVAVEKEPIPIKSPAPRYPDIAQRAGLEGTVYVKLWVDREGKVKKAVVLKSDAEVFNEAAIEAGKQWVFTPAQQQGKPVQVWVAVPFKFRLKDAGK
jgi:protein TonB